MAAKDSYLRPLVFFPGGRGVGGFSFSFPPALASFFEEGFRGYLEEWRTEWKW